MRKGSSLPPGVFDQKDGYGRRRWRQVQYLTSVSWKRWQKEYLLLLQERQKWNTPRRNLAVNDLVLVADETIPRGQWPLGKVVQVCGPCTTSRSESRNKILQEANSKALFAQSC